MTAEASTPAPPRRPELGLRAVYRQPADRLADGAAEAAAIIEMGEAVVAEPPRWRLDQTPLWTARLSLRAQRLVRTWVLFLTFGLVRLDSPPRGVEPDRWTLRQQVLEDRLPALRREIEAIGRRRHPIDQRAIGHELHEIGRVRAALWWSARAIRLRLRILSLQLQIAIVWLWVNREAILFYGVVALIVAGLVGLIWLLQQNQGSILDMMESVRSAAPRFDPVRSEPFFSGDD
ncbi:MAG: hypothetical protein IT306_06735 [Chloroflexi bacterium]|nr:hypothetical protein [Chloroflexota bacterium]